MYENDYLSELRCESVSMSYSIVNIILMVSSRERLEKIWILISVQWPLCVCELASSAYRAATLRYELEWTLNVWMCEKAGAWTSFPLVDL